MSSWSSSYFLWVSVLRSIDIIIIEDSIDIIITDIIIKQIKVCWLNDFILSYACLKVTFFIQYNCFIFYMYLISHVISSALCNILYYVECMFCSQVNDY